MINQTSLSLILSLVIISITFMANKAEAAPTGQAGNTSAAAVVEEKSDGEKESLFGNVVKALSKRFVDESFRENELPRWVELYKDRAMKANNLKAQREVVHEFLSNIPSSHLGLISAQSREHMMSELSGRSAATFGMELIEYDGKHYAFNVLEKGPADKAGIRRGDRVTTIDGLLVSDSPRLGWRTDDAFLPDPPVRFLNGELGDTLKLRIERRPGKYIDLDLPCEIYSTWEATQASARIVEQDGLRIGVIHFWLIQMKGPDALLQEKLEGEFATCDALVLDLRGRGGSGFMVKRMLDVLEGITSTWDKPIAALINEHSRSAKEVIAYEFRNRNIGSLVGERTAGAVIPVTMVDVGFGMNLMFPTFSMPKHTGKLEFIGVAPDVVVAEVGPYSAGADPIFEAGVVEAIRLAKSASWKERRAMKTSVASNASKKRTKRMRMPKGATAYSHAKRKKSKNPENSLKIEDPPGHDPRAIDVLEKMVNALGGEKSFRAHTAKTIKGTRNMGGMMEATFTSLHAAPNKFIQRMEIEGMGKMESGYNGIHAWEVSPHGGTSLMSDEDQADMIVESDFYGDLNYKKNHRSIVYAGLTEFDDKECHEIRLTKASGTVQIRYIDTTSYLPIGSISEVKSNMGPIIMTSVVKEFKEFDGEMIPVKTEEDVGGMQDMTSTITSVSFGPHDADTFDPPSEIIALDNE